MLPDTSPSADRTSPAHLFEQALPVGVEVIEGWGWKTGADEFGPDVMVFDQTDQQLRYTATPHLVVEILSSDPARDIIRKAAKYAAAGVDRYGIINADGTAVIAHLLIDGVLSERGRHGPGETATSSIGPTDVTFDPGQLLD